MTRRFILSLMFGVIALVADAAEADGFLPAESRLASLAILPAGPKGAGSRMVVRLAPAGRTMVLYRGSLVALAEQPESTMADWEPPPDVEPVQDFCWLDPQALAVLRETGLDFVRNGKLERGVVLPSRGMRLVRADAGHCYVFGGASALHSREVLLIGVDGSVRNLFRAPQRVTAVAGNGGSTFVAVGSVVYFLTPGEPPRAVFRERADITELAYAPPAGVFYLTADGVGCMDAPASGMLFLRREIMSMDSRGDRLLLLTKDREVLLVTPLAGFPRLLGAVQTFATEGDQPP